MAFSSAVTQDTLLGVPCFKLAWQDTRGGHIPTYAARSFGVSTSAVTHFQSDWQVNDVGGYSQAAWGVCRDASGQGISVMLLRTGSGWHFYIGTAANWADFGSHLVEATAADATFAVGTWYRMFITATVNHDFTITVVASARDTSDVELLTVTTTLTQPVGDFCGFYGVDNQLGATQIAYYTAIHVTATGPAGQTPQNTATSYVYTYVNNLGEESAPSPASVTILRPNGVSVTVTMYGPPAGTDPEYNIVSRRLYRAVTGTLGTLFLEVVTLPLATDVYVDILKDSQVGPNVLESQDWDLPPARLEGIIALPNGIMAGFFDNQLCLSERGRPHAWPVKYRMTTDTKIVAIGNVDNTIVVGTLSFVYTATGNLPESYSMSQPGEAQSCTSKRSMTYLDGMGVVFASPDGYQVCSGSAGAVRNATELIFTRRQWQALDPTSIIASVHDGVLHFFFAGTEPDSGYMLDVKPQGFGLVRTTFHATAMHSDPITDHLYVVLDSNSEPHDALLPLASTAVTPNGVTIFQFDADNTSDMVYRWRGRLNLTPYPVALAIAQVRALTFDNLIWRLYGDGVLIHEKVLHNQREFVLPLPGTFDTLEIELMGTSTVRNDQAAEDVGELA